VKAVIAFVIVLGILATIGWYAHRIVDGPPRSVEIHQVVEIPSDASFKAVATLLAHRGLIVSPWWFRLRGKLQDAERRIKPGEYDLHTRMRPAEILDTLVKGRVILYTVVVPEGLNARQISVLFKQAGLADEEALNGLVTNRDFAKSLGVEALSLEGYLFPDTYYFPRRTKPEEILRTMVSRFRQMFTSELQARAAEVNMTERETITLASIIEKETAQNDERSLISAVFHNRLRKRLPLQSDPTVIYDIPNFGGNLTRADLNRPTPFNTYIHAGLPPGPIANPGVKSIIAALNPASANYLYFVSRNDGTHQFSSSLEEHNRAVERYQKKAGRRAAVRGRK
jgi:UPF0755 protein